MSDLTMYTTSWCGYCVRLKMMLKQADVTFDEVNIETDPEAASFVMSVNGGNRTVPTVRFEDGTVFTNPTFRQVQSHLSNAART